MIKAFVTILVFIFFPGCNQQVNPVDIKPATVSETTASFSGFDTSNKTIHVLVALCDNKYQGIVPVPAKIGNGQDPDNNLYWGCANGVRSYFKNSSNWTILKRYFIDSIQLERIVFKHKRENFYLVADAYNGKQIRKCTIDFLQSCSGQLKDTLNINGKTIGINGNSKLVSYIGVLKPILYMMR